MLVIRIGIPRMSYLPEFDEIDEAVFVSIKHPKCLPQVLQHQTMKQYELYHHCRNGPGITFARYLLAYALGRTPDVWPTRIHGYSALLVKQLKQT